MNTYDEFKTAVRGIVEDDAMVEAVTEVCKACFEAADGKGNDYSTLKELAFWLLSQANLLNIYHWNVNNNTRHELLNEAYDLCRDTGDEMAETYMSITGKPCEGSTSSELKKFDGTKVLPLLKELQKHMQDAVKKNSGFSEGVKNIFADFDEKMTSIIYKYQQFES